MINQRNFYDIEKLRSDFLSAKPFNYVVIDNFLEEWLAEKIYDEIPNWDDKAWGVFYNNPIEVKKTTNHWDKFKEYTYKTFHYLNSKQFVDEVKYITDGFPGTIKCPDEISRKSLAVYYLQPPKDSNNRYRALFVPSKEQENDPSVVEFCKERSKL
ncbi:MAG: hypothetical protein ACO3UU_08785 [Minisyncoccia bacterium]